jgi:hypothetical protein
MPVAGLGLLASAGAATPASAAEPRCEEVLIELSDGARLHGWLRHGKVEGRTPVFWTTTPYTNDGCVSQGGSVTRGMADRARWLRLSYRGVGASEGEQDVWGPGDEKDLLEVADWIARQPWAAGIVPTGASAEGAWITFVLRHPAIKASLWHTSCADGYHGCVRSGGAFAGGGLILSAGQYQGYMEGLGDRLRNGTFTNPIPPAQLMGTLLNGYASITEDTYGPFWSSRLGLDKLAAVHTPVMFTTDLYDYVPQGMYLAYEATPPQHAWLSLGTGHNQPRTATKQGTKHYELVQTPIHRFLEHFVFDQRNGAERDARVTVVTNLGTVSGYKRAEVLVRPEPDWPLPSTRWSRLYLDGQRSGSSDSLNDGGLRLEPGADGADGAPLSTVSGPRGELRTLLAVLGAPEAREEVSTNDLIAASLDDLRPDERTGLTWTTAAFTQDLELTGPIVARIFASAIAPNFDWQVRLTDVHPDGRSSWITDGQLRASLRRVDPGRSRRNENGDIIRPWYPASEHEQVPPGEVVEYLIELAPTSNVFRKGHRLRLDVQPIAEGYVDSTRTGGVGALTVHRGRTRPSSILLPVIPGRCQKGVPAVAGISMPYCGEALAESLGACLARRSPIGPRNIGRVRLGYTRQGMLRRVKPRPIRRTRRVYRWCVKRSRGQVSAVFGWGRRAGLVTTTAVAHGFTTTAVAHGNRGVRPGRSARMLRAYPNRRRIMRGLYRATPRSQRLIGMRRGRVRFIAVADRRLLLSRGALRRHLRLAGLKR